MALINFRLTNETSGTTYHSGNNGANVEKVVTVFDKSLSASTRASVRLTDEQLKILGDEFSKFDIKAASVRPSEAADSDLSIDILGDNWRALASKKDKTEADYAALDEQYKTGMFNMGKARVRTIDKSGDGLVSKDEFFESEQIPASLNGSERIQAIQMKENAFQHLDQNKDNHIDAKEMAAYFSVIDFDVRKGGLNGKISVYDYFCQSLLLAKDKQDEKAKILDNNLKNAYNRMFGQK